MSSLTGSSISGTYGQLLALPNGGGGGPSAGLKPLTDGNGNTTFALQISDSAVHSTGSMSAASWTGVLDITDTTEASSNDGDSGALRCEGGASIAKKLYVGNNLDVNGTTQLDSTLTVGNDDNGHDVIFYGNRSGAYMKWDQFNDILELDIGIDDGTCLKLKTTNNRAKDIVWDEGGSTKGRIRFHNDTSGTDANDRLEIGTASDLDNLIIKGGEVIVATGLTAGNTSATGTFSSHAKVLCDSGTGGEGGLLFTNVNDAGSGYSSAKINGLHSGGAESADLQIGLVTNNAPNTFVRHWFYCDGPTGNVSIGGNTAGNGRLQVIDTETDASNPVVHIECTEASVEAADVMMRMDWSADSDVDAAAFISFHDGAGEIGSIKGDGDATAFNTSSDYRLKTDLKAIPDATAIVNQLKIYDFAWKKNSSKRLTGVLAHEAQAVVPYAVTGAKDAMIDMIKTSAKEEIKDIEGNIVQAKVDEVKESVISPQSVDYSKFVPLLIQAVQELSAKVTALENA